MLQTLPVASPELPIRLQNRPAAAVRAAVVEVAAVLVRVHALDAPVPVQVEEGNGT